LLTYFLIGAALGALTGVPIGPLNVAIIDAAYRHHLRRAIAVALGGAAADLTYASLGIGLGHVLTAQKSVPPILYSVSGVVLIIYGILTVRAQPVDPGVAGQGDVEGKSYFWGGFGTGIALILLNPATLITWVVIVGSHMPDDITRAEGLATAIGIGSGSAMWFTVVAHLANHGKKLLGKKTVWLTRVVGLGLICYGVFSIGRAVWHLTRLW